MHLSQLTLTKAASLLANSVNKLAGIGGSRPLTVPTAVTSAVLHTTTPSRSLAAVMWVLLPTPGNSSSVSVPNYSSGLPQAYVKPRWLPRIVLAIFPERSGGFVVAAGLTVGGVSKYREI